MLMEVINGFVATVYERQNIEEAGQKIEWESKYIIRRFPKHLASNTSVNYLFSPNFTYQLDYIYSEAKFVIRKTETQEIVFHIPNDLINLKKSNTEGGGRMGVAIYASRINFVSEDMIKIINDNQLECLFKIEAPTDGTKGTLVLKSAVKMDNIASNFTTLDGPHLTLDPKVLNVDQTFERLIRNNQKYKSKVFHAKNLKDSNFNLLSHLFSHLCAFIFMSPASPFGFSAYVDFLF